MCDVMNWSFWLSIITKRTTTDLKTNYEVVHKWRHTPSVEKGWWFFDIWHQYLNLNTFQLKKFVVTVRKTKTLFKWVTSWTDVVYWWHNSGLPCKTTTWIKVYWRRLCLLQNSELKRRVYSDPPPGGPPLTKIPFALSSEEIS